MKLLLLTNKYCYLLNNIQIINIQCVDNVNLLIYYADCCNVLLEDVIQLIII